MTSKQTTASRAAEKVAQSTPPEAGTATAATAPAGIAAASEFSPSGAPVQIASEIDPEHPAIDANPRERTTEQQNRRDMNDPTLSGAEAVQKNLAAQG